MSDLFRDVTEGPARVYSMADNENSTSSYVLLNNNLFLYAFVDCSTNIEVVITELLEYMAVRAKMNRSLPFIPKFNQEKRPKR